MCHNRVFSLGILEILNSYIVSPSLKWFRGCITGGKHFYVICAWMWGRCRYHVVFFHCIISRLAMCHNRVFSLGILEILKRYIVSPSLKCPRGGNTRVKHFYVRCALMWARCRYHVVFIHCILSSLAMFQSHVFSINILEILNRCIISRSIKCPSRYLTRRKHFYVKSAYMWHCCRYH